MYCECAHMDTSARGFSCLGLGSVIDPLLQTSLAVHSSLNRRQSCVFSQRSGEEFVEEPEDVEEREIGQSNLISDEESGAVGVQELFVSSEEGNDFLVHESTEDLDLNFFALLVKPRLQLDEEIFNAHHHLIHLCLFPFVLSCQIELLRQISLDCSRLRQFLSPVDLEHRQLAVRHTTLHCDPLSSVDSLVLEGNSRLHEDEPDRFRSSHEVEVDQLVRVGHV
ncbi:hypothetical protein PFISCL1PPCAC_26731 [Pristionchus fissidentatus]|uniref:Uncharacterized protein n=1 Tax=Pristionchus fissidentatus TaxID=1538716 RepID=A0AAV5WTB2_9BILA|nr:hypothetical protein PFISCL1PPCAC_26731 [Pristionchus fissidentatus]